MALGLFDIFGGGSGPEKALKLKAKVVQKYGDAAARQKAIQQLGEMDIPEATSALIARFTINVDPATTDADEKEHVFELIKDRGDKAVEPVKHFLMTNDAASSWALKILAAILPEPEAIGAAISVLQKLGAGYARDPERKLVMMHFLEEKEDPRIVDAVLPFVDDMDDDVRITAVKLLARRKDERAREPFLQLLTNPDIAKRVQTAVIAGLCEAGFGVQGYREKVEALVSDPYFVDKSGVIKKRG